MDQESFDQNSEAGTVAGAVGRRGAVALATALGAGAAGLVGGMGRAFAQSGPYPGLPRRPLKFVFVCHVALDPFFVPAIYGAQDACAAFGCRYQWTGSLNNTVSEMVNAMETAIDEKADGIAVCLVDPKAFDAPTARAIAAGIPVVAFNADVPKGSPNQRVSYVGQPLFESGYDNAAKFMSRVPKGGHVMLSIGVPGSLNEQPRIDGYIQWIKDNGNPVTYDVVNTGVDAATSIARISSYVLSHKNLAGIFCGGGSDTYAAGFVSAEYWLGQEGRDHRRFRPVSADPEIHQERRYDLHDRSAGLSAGLPAGSAALHVQAVEGAGRPCRYQHQQGLRHLGERRLLSGEIAV